MQNAELPTNEEAERFLADNPDIESVDFLIPDINGVMRGKWGQTEALAKVGYPGINMPLSIFGLDIWGREVEATGIHIETGDIDGYCRAIPGRINRAPWSPRPSAQVLMSMYTETGEALRLSIHAMRCNVSMDRYAAEKGLTPVTAFELEFYLVDPAVFQRSGRMGKDKGPGPDQQQMYSLFELRGQSELFAEIRAAAVAQGLPIDTIIKEAAPGQFEVNLKHRAMQWLPPTTPCCCAG
jgi:glutamine synthetase